MRHLTLLVVLTRLALGQAETCTVGNQTIVDGLIKRCIDNGTIHEDVVGCEVVDVHNKTVTLEFGETYFEINAGLSGMNRKCLKTGIITIGCYTYDINTDTNKAIEQNGTQISEHSKEDPYVFHCICDGVATCYVKIDRCVVGTERTWKDHVYKCVTNGTRIYEEIIACRAVNEKNEAVVLDVGQIYFAKHIYGVGYGEIRKCSTHSWNTVIGCYVFDVTLNDYKTINSPGIINATLAKEDEQKSFVCRACSTESPNPCFIEEKCLLGTHDVEDGRIYTCEKSEDGFDLQVDYQQTGCVLDDAEKGAVNLTLGEQYLEESYNEYGPIYECRKWYEKPRHVGCWVYDVTTKEYKRFNATSPIDAAPRDKDDVRTFECKICKYDEHSFGDFQVVDSTCGVKVDCKHGDIRYNGTFITKCVEDKTSGDFTELFVGCQVRTVYNATKLTNLNISQQFLSAPRRSNDNYGLVGKCEDGAIAFNGCWVFNNHTQQYVNIGLGKSEVIPGDSETKLKYTCVQCTEDEGDPTQACDVDDEEIDIEITTMATEAPIKNCNKKAKKHL